MSTIKIVVLVVVVIQLLFHVSTQTRFHSSCHGL